VVTYIPLILVILLFVAALRFSARMATARPSDFEAIHKLASERGLRIISIEQRYNQWPYWLRGHIRLSNLSRIFVIFAQSREGRSRVLHVAFDNNWGASHDIQVLRDIAIAP
jgi:hypothetical protein